MQPYHLLSYRALRQGQAYSMHWAVDYKAKNILHILILEYTIVTSYESWYITRITQCINLFQTSPLTRSAFLITICQVLTTI
jgi:hypothetical protein